MNSLPAADIKELVRSKTDLVALIGENVRLQPRSGGRAFAGLCPFHDDHNPSFQVNPERQTYRCWVCNEGGDCFSYVMKYESVGFREALEMLAARAGVELPKSGGLGGSNENSREQTSLKQQLYEVLAWAENEFHRMLLTGQPGQRARDYLRSRHFREETLLEYKLGYAPASWDWLQERARGRYSADLLVQAGLAKSREGQRGAYDFFRDRVIFPIHDERGRVVSFGGRVLPDSTDENVGKYLNGVDSLVFHKSKLVFGLDKARRAIGDSGAAVVTEGYADCIKAHQAGVLNAVGTLGTALTETHVTILKRTARRVVLVYDGDTAGKNAALRAIEKFLAQDVDLRILTLPDELDPDDYLEAHGVESFERLIASAPEAWDFQLRHCLARHGDSIDGRLRSLDEMLTLLTVVPGMSGTLRETTLMARVAGRLGFSEGDAQRRLKELRQGRAVGASRKVSAEVAPASEESRVRRDAIVSLQRRPRKDDLLETELLQILFTAPSTIGRVRQDVGVDDFRNPALRDLLAICFDLWDHGDLPDFHRVLAAVEAPDLKSLVVWIDEQATFRGIAEQLAADGPVTLVGEVLEGASDLPRPAQVKGSTDPNERDGLGSGRFVRDATLRQTADAFDGEDSGVSDGVAAEPELMNLGFGTNSAWDSAPTEGHGLLVEETETVPFPGSANRSSTTGDSTAGRTRIHGRRERTRVEGLPVSSSGLLAKVLAELKWRRECDQELALRGERAARLENASGLNSDVRDLLARSMSFHQQRAGKK